jgi:O-antigen/teichoic acid export membrane protein
VLTNIDVVLAKHYLTASDAGNYSAMSVLGKVAFYAPTTVAAAMFPKTSALFERGEDHRRAFTRAMTLTVLIAGSVVILYTLFPHALTQFLFNGKYHLVGPYLATYGLAMGLLAVSFLAMSYFLSVNQTKVAFSLLGVMLLEIVLIVAFHSGVGQLVKVMFVCGISSIVAMLPFYFRRTSQAPTQPTVKGANKVGDETNE